MLLLLATVFAAGCSSKKAASKSSPAGGTKKTVQAGDDDAGSTDDPCAGTSLAAEGTEATDAACSPGDDGDDGDALPPDGAFYETVLSPGAKDACHTSGKVFGWTAQDCLDAGYPAAFTCDRAGVLGAFGNAPEVATALDELEAGKWVYDQCGVDAGSKPFIVMVCPTSGDQVCPPDGTPVCKTQDELDVAAMKICEKHLHL